MFSFGERHRAHNTVVYQLKSGSEELKGGSGALCFEWGFTRTFPGNQDVAVKQKFEVVHVRFW